LSNVRDKRPEARRSSCSRIFAPVRAFAGTVLAAMALNELESFDSAAQAKRNLRAPM
jgi:hypothetical protein